MITMLIVIYLGWIGVLKPGCLSGWCETAIQVAMLFETVVELLFIFRKGKK